LPSALLVVVLVSGAAASVYDAPLVGELAPTQRVIVVGSRAGRREAMPKDAHASSQSGASSWLR
jgi:hypothetical protein